MPLHATGGAYAPWDAPLNQLSAENRYLLVARRGPRWSAAVGLLVYLGGRTAETVDTLANLAGIPGSTFARYLRAARLDGCIERAQGRELRLTPWARSTWHAWKECGGFLKLDPEERGAVSLSRRIVAEVRSAPFLKRGFLPSTRSMAFDFRASRRGVQLALQACERAGTVVRGAGVRVVNRAALTMRAVFEVPLYFAPRVPVPLAPRFVDSGALLNQKCACPEQPPENDPARSFQPGRVARSAKQNGPRKLFESVGSTLAALRRPT